MKSNFQTENSRSKEGGSHAVLNRDSIDSTDINKKATIIQISPKLSSERSQQYGSLNVNLPV